MTCARCGGQGCADCGQPRDDPGAVRWVLCSGCPQGWCKGVDYRGPWECCPDPQMMREGDS